MKTLALLVAMAAAASASTDDRLCPDGYIYSGDDSRFIPDNDPMPRSYYYEEGDRTPVYSCYKMVEEVTDWLSAMHFCWEEEAQLASFEDGLELNRILAHYRYKLTEAEGASSDNSNVDSPTAIDRFDTYDFFTSGMYFRDNANWYWLSANRSINQDLPEFHITNQVDQEPTAIGSYPRDCLTLRMTQTSVDDRVVTHELRAENCFAKANYLCEARVQTVTYYSWFYTNWVDLLLGFLLVIMFIALCVSVCAYSAKGSSSPKRKTDKMATSGYGVTRSHRRTPAMVNLEALDAPPKYEHAVKIHRPDEEQEGKQMSNRMDYYRMRGKDLMAKVYLYKPKSSNASDNASTTSS